VKDRALGDHRSVQNIEKSVIIPGNPEVLLDESVGLRKNDHSVVS